MTVHVYRDHGDSLQLTAYPEAGEVRIWGTGSSKESPDAVIHTTRPVTLYTERLPCDRPHRSPESPSAWVVFGLGCSVGVIVLSLVLVVFK